MRAIEEEDISIKKDIIIEDIMMSRGLYYLVSNAKVGKSIAHLKGNHTIEENEIDYDDFELEADEINAEYDKDKEEDFEITM